MNVLLIGSGGREHALAWSIAKSSQLTTLFVAPGNAGTQSMGSNVKNISLNISHPDEIIQWCTDQQIKLVMIGPEAPLVDGLFDHLSAAGIATVGPSKAASELEGSKEFTKQICDRYQIPTASYAAFSETNQALEYLDNQTFPIVIKADGLAAGKGVVIAHTHSEAATAIHDMLVKDTFGHAGNRIVIEEFLEGEELSFFALSDGEHVLPFGSAQDHKAAYDGDKGPNTGGMGTYSPAPVLSNALHNTIMQTIITPLINGMKQENKPFQGVVFAGLMIKNNQPKLLEINVRFGDPETQVLMARLESDLLALLLATAHGTLKQSTITLSDQTALCVVMAAQGYPGSYKKGSVIRHLEAASDLDQVTIFHAGTKYNDKNELTSNGGRVLGVTALADDVSSAQSLAYQAIRTIDWPEGYYRSDIGYRAIDRTS